MLLYYCCKDSDYRANLKKNENIFFLLGWQGGLAPAISLVSFCLRYIAPLRGVTGTAEVVLNAIAEGTHYDFLSVL